MSSFKDLFRDNTYDGRKVINAPAVLLAAHQMGHSYKDIADICKTQKSRISDWKNPDKKDLPTGHQLEPLINVCGASRINLELEELSAAARQYRKGEQIVAMTLLFIIIIATAYYVGGKPCRDSWEKCQQLKWYERPFYNRVSMKG